MTSSRAESMDGARVGVGVLVVLLMATVLVGAAGELTTRCYCNEATCVSTGYMCKSTSVGVCYSELTREGTNVRSTHGCAETLPEVDYGACVATSAAGGGGRRRRHSTSGSGGGSLLLCCSIDMCNYMDAETLRSIFVDPATTQNKSVSGSDSDVTGSRSDVTVDRQWLRAAIIVVPVAGLCILIPLVALALRMLTADRRRRSTSAVSTSGHVMPGVIETLATKNGNIGICKYCESGAGCGRGRGSLLLPVSQTGNDVTSRGGCRSNFLQFAGVHGKRRGGYEQMTSSPLPPTSHLDCGSYRSCPIASIATDPEFANNSESRLVSVWPEDEQRNCQGSNWRSADPV